METKKVSIRVLFLMPLIIFIGFGCGIERSRKAPIYTYKIVKAYKHDVTSFTQGLLIDGDFLYEGTGLHNRSKLLKIDLNTGKILKEHTLDSRYFGEGITILGDEIFQLTLDSKIGFVYDKNSFEVKRRFHYPTQGWGLTTDGKDLIMSNGSATILFLDPATLEQKRHIIVSDGDWQVDRLNELEYIDGEIYANVWETDFIAIISPVTGRVKGWIDLTGINPDSLKINDSYVLNGIAYDKKAKRLFITGKCWSKIYEIVLAPL